MGGQYVTPGVEAAKTGESNTHEKEKWRTRKCQWIAKFSSDSVWLQLSEFVGFGVFSSQNILGFRTGAETQRRAGGLG